MKFSSLALSSVLFGINPFVSSSQLRGVKVLHDVRYLHTNDFQPLGCNKDLDTAVCQTWTERYGTATSFSSKVVIICGECIVVDLQSPTLNLEAGLEIRGKLVFPDDYGLILTTPSIVVLGELMMTSTGPVNGEPVIKFLMTGQNDNSFEPTGPNIDACHGNPCSVGKKAFAVAGGKVTLKGLPQATPTWLKLEDVESTLGSDDSLALPYQPPPTELPSCNVDGEYFSIDFESSCEIGDSFGVTHGSKFECRGSDFVVYNRTSTLHGSLIDLKHVRSCLEPSRPYLLTVKVVTSKLDDAGETFPECSTDGENCLTVQHEVMRFDTSRKRRVLWQESPSFNRKHNEVVTIALEMSFDEDELMVDNVYQLITLTGPPGTADMKIRQWNFFLPMFNMFPKDGEVCKSLAPSNRNGELETKGSPYPFHSTHPWVFLSVVHESLGTQNGYFQVRGRGGRDFADAGIAWKMEKGCIDEAVQLHFRADFRASVSSFALRPVVRVETSSGGRSHYILAECPKVNGSSWTSCEGLFTVPPDMMSPSVERIEIRLGGTSNIDFDVDNINLTIAGNPPNILVVANDVLSKWAPGAEILLTSHTADYAGHQLRKIVDIQAHSDGQHAKVMLDAPIVRPTTRKDSEDLAIEVALLSRNIVFEGDSDVNPLHGGHFIVMHTPLVEQHIEGIEFVNFGQQGTLGRYPIHFHFSGDCSGSIVSKNTIRQSKQRAIVVHGTDFLEVRENIAFDTQGHAFMTEDGIERGNHFVRNLAAFTRAVSDIIPDSGFNGHETDGMPASFWASNPSNSWVGNVAAGSQSSGFWFELRLRGVKSDAYASILNPRTSSLGEFLNNVAHSNADRGLRTYPVGWLPDEKANLIGFKSYRNGKKGLFFHVTQNVDIINATFLDNPMAIDLDRSEEIRVTDTKIIGRSEIQKQLEDLQNVPTVCEGDSLVGIEIHTYVRQAANNGAYIDVAFDGFDASTCGSVSHLQLDNEMLLGTFDWFTTLERVSFANQPVLVNFCPANTAGIVDAYLTDLDGSAKPESHSSAGPGSLISSSPIMNAFVDPNKCTEINEGCYTYCSHCFRSVRFDVDPTGTTGLMMEIRRKSTGVSTQIPGYINPEKEKEGSSIGNTRVFYAHLPSDEYEVSFSFWPTFVVQEYEGKLCPDGFDDDAVQLIVPPVADECTNLIRNGDAEAPNEAFWLTRFSGVTSRVGSGLGGSKALRDVDIISDRDALVQFLDTRCFSTHHKHTLYEVTAWIKLVDESNAPVKCIQKSGSCPEVHISSPQKTVTKVATLVPQLEESNFQLLHGVFQIPSTLQGADQIEFILERNQARNLNLEADNISMVALPIGDVLHDACQKQKNMVYNGDFISGNAKFWSQSTASMDLNDSPNGYTLYLKDGLARVLLKHGCLHEGQAYDVSITYRILNSNGEVTACGSGEPGNGLCPSSSILFFRDGTFISQFRVADDFDSGSNGWRALQGIYTIPSGVLNDTDMAVIQMDGFDPSNTYVIDNVSFNERDQVCSESMVANSDMSSGFKSYWTGMPNSQVGITKGVNDDYALKSFARTQSIQGPKYNAALFFDKSCLLPGVRLEIQSKVQLRVAGTDTPAACEVGSEKVNDNACPAFRFKLQDSSGLLTFIEDVRSYEATFWDEKGWNLLKGDFYLPKATEWDGTISNSGLVLRFLSFPAKWDMILDDFVIRTIP